MTCNHKSKNVDVFGVLDRHDRQAYDLTLLLRVHHVEPQRKVTQNLSFSLKILSYQFHFSSVVFEEGTERGFMVTQDSKSGSETNGE